MTFNQFLLGNFSKWYGGGKLFFPHHWGNFCWLVYTWIPYKICSVSFQGKLYYIFLNLSILCCQFDFMLSFLNVIDLLGILPFFISLILNQLSSQYSLEYIAKATQIFRILRILRIFKVSRHIAGLKTLGTTLRNSHRWIFINDIYKQT